MIGAGLFALVLGVPLGAHCSKRLPADLDGLIPRAVQTMSGKSMESVGHVSRLIDASLRETAQTMLIVGAGEVLYPQSLDCLLLRN